MAKRLQTPERIRTLQRKLYLKAKAEPDCRFHQLYDKVWRGDILLHAWELALLNGGAPGVALSDSHILVDFLPHIPCELSAVLDGLEIGPA